MIHKDAYLANSSLLKAHPSLLYRHMTIMRTLSSWVSGVMIYCHLVSGFGLMETTIWCRHLDLYSVKCEYYLKLVASLSFLSALIQEHVLSVRPSVQFRAITRGWSLSKKTDWRPLSYKKVNYVIHYNSNKSAFRSSFFFFFKQESSLHDWDQTCFFANIWCAASVWPQTCCLSWIVLLIKRSSRSASFLIIEEFLPDFTHKSCYLFVSHSRKKNQECFMPQYLLHFFRTGKNTV